MLKIVDARHGDLRTGRGPWLPWYVRPAGVVPAADISCDVAIVGGGITGALLAQHLSASGHDVVVIDREREGWGSTAASTAMLQWEIDLPMRELSRLYGFDVAKEVYHCSFRALKGLRGLVAELRLGCGFMPRDTVYLAAGEIGLRELAEEDALRQRAGLPGELLDHAILLAEFGFDRAAAIVSSGSAEADPLSLCHAMLAHAVVLGARMVRGDAVSYDGTARSAAVQLASGRIVEAKHVVLATGYVMPECVHSDLHRSASSWAIATPPQAPEALWRGRALIWEAAKDYIYCRTTADGRIVLGGEDEDSDDPDLRERLGPEKTKALLGKLQALLPQAEATVDFAWSGAFGQTTDGLPLIGRVPGQPRMLAAYGYGGNGITFSFMASRLIAALVAGKEAPWFRHFAIDRPDPTRP